MVAEVSEFIEVSVLVFQTTAGDYPWPSFFLALAPLALPFNPLFELLTAISCSKCGGVAVLALEMTIGQ